MKSSPTIRLILTDPFGLTFALCTFGPSWIFFFFFFKKFTFFYLFIYDCVESSFLCDGLSPVAASGDHSSSRCMGLLLSRPLLLRSTGSRRAGSVIVAHGPSCSVACGIFPDRGSNPCPLHWQADSQPLRHQGSPSLVDFEAAHGALGRVLLVLTSPAICSLYKSFFFSLGLSWW